jgi:putative intracellular protease/amidase
MRVERCFARIGEFHKSKEYTMKKATTLSLFLTILTILISNVTVSAQATAAPTAKPKPNVAILIFEGVQIIDYTGPYEVLGSWRRRNVYTVAEKAEPVTTNMGMRVIPNYTFENSPKPDILVIPGGGNSVAGEKGRGVGAQLNNANLIRWIQERAKESTYVMSVCNGAFLLARAGLLDGLEATTTAGMIGELKSVAPKTRVVSDRRFVDNGKVITTAGLSSGIDGALHLIERIDGLGWAQLVATSIEYNWQPTSGYARASLADMKLPEGIYEPIFPIGTPVSQSGGTDAWEEKWNVPATSAEDLLKSINNKWAAEQSWTRINANQAHSSETSVWRLEDEAGKSWVATAKAEPIAGQPNRVLVTLRIVNAEKLSGVRAKKRA